MDTIVNGLPKRLKPYPAYKPSCVEWLGEIPAHWEVKQLKRLCTFQYGDSLAADSRAEGNVRVYGSNGPVGNHNISNTRGPCLVIGRKGSFGKVNFSSPSVFAIDTTFFVDSRHTDAQLRWLYYLLTVIRLDAATKDSAIPGLHREDAYVHMVPVCALSEQHAIAAFLDRETAKIDGLVAKKERLIELLQEKRTALISRAVTRGLDPNVPMKDSGVEWLGEIPAHWEMGRLRSTTLNSQNGVWGTEPDGKSDIPCVRVADFDRVTFRAITDWPTLRSIDPGVVETRGLHTGDLLLEVSGGGEKQPVGVVVVYDNVERAVCSNFIARLRPTKGYDSRFLTYLHSKLYSARINVRSIKQSIGIQNLDKASYLNEMVGFPPISEQQSIAEYLDRETVRLDTVVAKARKAIDHLKELRVALISAAVTGRIDVRQEVP